MNNRNYNKVPTNRSKVAKREKKINISAMALEDFIWMSYRYCIGRRTGAAAMHTDNIAKLIGDNPDIFSKERLEFNAVDIRRQINQVCTYGDSIEVNTCRDG